VDATQGVEAQTLATFYLAFELDLAIVPVVNKIDAPTADLERVTAQMEAAFGIAPDEVVAVSAKTGAGVRELLDVICERVPPPPETPADQPLRALLLDCQYDQYRGTISLIQVVDGELRKGDRVAWASDQGSSSPSSYEVLELGMLTPEAKALSTLSAGRVGYVITGDRSGKTARIGDTLLRTADLASSPSRVAALPGFREAKPMVFQGLYPESADEYDNLRVAMDKLTMNDASVTVAHESSAALGFGFRCGFLGLLHAEVFHQRLREEFGREVIATAPTVPYRLVKLLESSGEREEEEIRTPAELPSSSSSSSSSSSGVVVEEPIVEATVVCPTDAVGRMVELCVGRRGEQLEHTVLGEHRALLRYRIPLGEIAADFADEVKSRSAGYASFDYEEAGFQAADVVRLDLLVNGAPVDALATIVHRADAQRKGRSLAKRLSELVSRQLFEVVIQAAVAGKVVARESLSALRRNVTAKCYGGDVSRKKKLLAKQKEGKKRMKRIGSVDIPHTAFAKLLRN